MPHCDPETLALRSLGETVGTSDDEAHLATCDTCQVQVASLKSVVTTARSEGPVDLISPPPAVWDRISAELGLASATAPASAETTTGSAQVVSLAERRERRSRPAPWLLAAASVSGIVVGGVVTATVLDSSSEPPVTVAASVDLEPLPDWDASGSAELRLRDSGEQVLVVSLSADQAAAADGYQEVWLIDSNVEGMVSLGVLEGSSGEFVVPAGIDVAEFPIVDVSLEPTDGVPTHSGNSIARGQIEA
ncbi:MAG: anti-sigma factor [Jiangellales bacterium]